MKKLILLVGIIVILMAVTNPSKIEYVEWAKEKIKEESPNEIVNWGIELLAPNLLDGSTTSKNYVIFSVYKTKVFDETITTIGLFKNFISLPFEGTNSIQTSTNIIESRVESPSENTISSRTVNSSDEYRDSPFVRNSYDNPLNNYLIWKGELEDESLDVSLVDGMAQLVVGLDHPNGINIAVLHNNTAWSLDWNTRGESPLYEFGTPESEQYSVQGTTYDFDKDGNEEIIISIGDGLVIGQFWIYTYQPNMTRSDISPYRLLLTQGFQENIYIEDNSVTIPYGSQGLFDEFRYINGGFLKRTH